MTRVFANAAVGYALVLTVCVVTFSVSGSARQTGSVSEGVYSTAQAERARPLYQQRCALCHGDQLQGAGVGSPLTGPDFLANWSGRPLSDLVDKVQKTMPFDAPGSLSRQESIDLTARILQAGRFPAGRAELIEGALSGVRLPTVRAAAAPVAVSSAALPPPVGNLAELMRAIAFYNSNIIFNLQLGNPANAPKKPQPAQFDYVEWGYTIYPGWLAVDQAAVALTDTAHVTLNARTAMPKRTARACGSSRLAEICRRSHQGRQGHLCGIQGAQLRTDGGAERDLECGVRELPQGVPRQRGSRGQRRQPMPSHAVAARPGVQSTSQNDAAGIRSTGGSVQSHRERHGT